MKYAEHARIDELSGQTIVVDGTSWVYELKGNASLDRKVVAEQFFERIFKLIESNINPIVLFEEIDAIRRKKLRNSKSVKELPCNPTMVDIANLCTQLKNVLLALQISCMTTSISTCKHGALLEYNGKASGTFTKDPEYLFYGGRKMYMLDWYDKNELLHNVKMLSMDSVERDFNLFRNRLLTIGMFLGCDTIPGGFQNIGAVIAIEIVSEFTLSEDDSPIVIFERFRGFMKNEIICKNTNSTLNKLKRVNFVIPPAYNDTDELTKKVSVYLYSDVEIYSGDKYCRCFPYFCTSVEGFTFNPTIEKPSFNEIAYQRIVKYNSEKLSIEGTSLLKTFEKALSLADQVRDRLSSRTISDSVSSSRKFENIGCSKREMAALSKLRLKDEYYVVKSDEAVEVSDSIVAHPSSSGSNGSSPPAELNGEYSRHLVSSAYMAGGNNANTTVQNDTCTKGLRRHGDEIDGQNSPPKTKKTRV
uniref:XPGI domain-containing protein n=1 Tax=Rhabditophanes sp. KR3021 TaxID=114890 RepID=A0AC35TP46_9BILA